MTVCAICKDLILGKLTAKEAESNLLEMADGMDLEHAMEVAIQIEEKIKESERSMP